MNCKIIFLSFLYVTFLALQNVEGQYSWQGNWRSRAFMSRNWGAGGGWSPSLNSGALMNRNTGAAGGCNPNWNPGSLMSQNPCAGRGWSPNWNSGSLMSQNAGAGSGRNPKWNSEVFISPKWGGGTGWSPGWNSGGFKIQNWGTASRSKDRSRSRNKGRQGASCPQLQMPKGGSLDCKMSPAQEVCSSQCLPGYTFEGTNKNKIFLTCSKKNGVWKPYRKFPNCKSDGSCRLKLVGAGDVKCKTVMEGTFCDVRCNDRNEGKYFCTEGNKWSPRLPKCVRPLLDKSNTSGPRASCPQLQMPKGGSLKCQMSPAQEVCSSQCLPGYTFEGTNKNKIFLTCSKKNGVWKPYRKFPNCKSDGSCRLEIVRAGDVKCKTIMEGTFCDVRCNDRNEGRYFCTEGNKWSPRLPKCVRPSSEKRNDKRENLSYNYYEDYY